MKRRRDYSHIYALVEPDTDTVRYIGQSIHPTTRLAQHLSDARCLLYKTPVYQWIRALAAKGQKSKLIILGRFAASRIVQHEARFIELHRSTVLNCYRPARLGYTGNPHERIEHIESGERFLSKAAAARALGCSLIDINDPNEFRKVIL